MPAWFQYFGYGTAVVAILIFADSLRRFVRAPSGYGHRYHIVVTMIAALYPAGLTFKLLILGPEFFRFHLTDIGFPVVVGWIIMSHARQRHNDAGTRLDDHYREQIAETTTYIRAIIIGCGLSYAYESFVGLFYWFLADRLVGQTNLLVGNFDPVDMLMYTLGAGTAVLLLMRERKLTREVLLPRALRMLRERDAANRLVERQQRRQQPPVSNKPRRRRKNGRR